MARKLTPSTNPTDPAQALVAGIVAPAMPVAVAAPVSATPLVTTPSTTTVPQAPSSAQVTGIAPVPVAQIPVTETLPTQQDSNVQDALNAITSQDSDLMKLARTQGLQQANARGVLNSSIGVGAAQAEAYRAALPLAQQQASENAAVNQQRYDIAAQMDRLRAQAGYEQNTQAQQYEYNAALNTQSYAFQAQQLSNQQTFQKQMASIQQGYAVDMANLQETLQSKLQSEANDQQIQRMGVEFQNQMALQTSQASNVLDQIKAQGDVQLTLQANQFSEAMKELTLQLNQQNSIALANASVNLFNAQAGIQAALLANPNISSAERSAFEQQISSMVQPVQNYVSGVLGYVPGSSSTPTAPPTYPTTPPATTGGSTGGIAPQLPGAPTTQAQLDAMKSDGIPGDYKYYSGLGLSLT